MLLIVTIINLFRAGTEYIPLIDQRIRCLNDYGTKNDLHPTIEMYKHSNLVLTVKH